MGKRLRRRAKPEGQVRALIQADQGIDNLYAYVSELVSEKVKPRAVILFEVDADGTTRFSTFGEVLAGDLALMGADCLARASGR